jgi:hypothetical protein
VQIGLVQVEKFGSVRLFADPKLVRAVRELLNEDM